VERQNDLEGKGTGITPKPSEFTVMVEVMLMMTTTREREAYNKKTGCRT
jgi:hypothetical protein